MVQTSRSPARWGRSVAFVLIGCAGLVVGCGKKPESHPAAPAALPKASLPLPSRLPGLWEMTVTEDSSEDMPQVLQICIDAATDKHLGILGTDLSGDHCQTTVSKEAPDGWGLLSACEVGNGVTTEYSGSVSGDFNSAYMMKLRSQTSSSGAPQMTSSASQMNRVTNYTVAAKRLGDCARDQQPGDVTNDGVRFNLFDMAGLRPKSHVSASADSAAPTDD